MKKIGVIVPVVLLAVFGLIVMSCDDVYSNVAAAEKAVKAKLSALEKTVVIDVAAESGGTLVLASNHQYGSGFQGKIQDLDLFNNYAIKEGDEFIVDYEFTASRAIDVPLTFGFVDENPDRDYWGPLTWDDGEEGPKEFDSPIAAGATVKGLTGFVAISDATDKNSSGKSYNTLFFQTDVEDIAKGSVTLTFTKFEITLNKAD